MVFQGEVFASYGPWDCFHSISRLEIASEKSGHQAPPNIHIHFIVLLYITLYLQNKAVFIIIFFFCDYN